MAIDSPKRPCEYRPKKRKYAVYMKDLEHLPLEIRIFIMAYVKTGRPDVAYIAAYPESRGSMANQARRGRAILAQPEVNKEVTKAVANVGVTEADCFKILKEIMEASTKDEMKNAQVKLRAATTLLGILNSKKAEDQEMKKNMEEALGLSLVEGLQEANDVRDKRNSA